MITSQATVAARTALATAPKARKPSSTEDVIAWINPDPAMPRIMIMIQLVEGYEFRDGISYDAIIRYTEHGRSDETPRAKGKTSPVTGNVALFGLELTRGIQGGELDASFGLPVSSGGNNSTIQLRIRKRVAGRNPTRAEVQARLRTVELQVTAYRESRFEQFNQDGRPKWGPPNGFGIMQLDTPAPTAEQIWNWKQNVDRGIALFREKATAARGYAERMRKKHNAPNLRDLTTAELKLETYQRYNGGAYWKPKKTAAGWTWIAAPPNGYADESLRIEKLVIDGTPPPDWNDPRPVPVPLRGRRTRARRTRARARTSGRGRRS